MDERTILRLATYFVASVALIVTGAIGRGIVSRDSKPWWTTAAAAVIALATAAVAYKLAMTRTYWGY